MDWLENVDTKVKKEAAIDRWERPADSTTVAEYADEYCVQRAVARTRLKKLVEQGLLVETPVNLKGGSRTHVYCRPEDGPNA